jgi:hypothetical protein
MAPTTSRRGACSRPAEFAPSCAEAGVLGALPGIVGSIQALETIKVILGLGEPLIGRILSVDATEMEFLVFNLRKDPNNEVTFENRDRIIRQELDGFWAGPGAPLTASAEVVARVRATGPLPHGMTSTDRPERKLTKC